MGQAVAAAGGEEEPKPLLALPEVVTAAANKQIRPGLGGPAGDVTGATLPPTLRARGRGAERGRQTRVAAREGGGAAAGGTGRGAGGGRVKGGMGAGNPKIVYIYIVTCGSRMS
jgi:hypothetical protein